MSAPLTDHERALLRMAHLDLELDRLASAARTVCEGRRSITRTSMQSTVLTDDVLELERIVNEADKTLKAKY